MSDTHGNSRLMHEAADAMIERFKAETIFHLGDDYRDADDLFACGYTVYRVPGLWCPEYQNGRIPKRLIVTFDGIRVACAHADKDLRFEERASEIILTGHTHVANIAIFGKSLYLNPGHLKSPMGRGERASYAVIEIGEEAIHASIHEIGTDETRTELTVSRAKLTS
jgi:predicted phosphodiesterase